MVNSSLENRVRYGTNAAGEATDVWVPLDLWQQLINALQSPASGVAWVHGCELLQRKVDLVMKDGLKHHIGERILQEVIYL